MYDAQLVFMRCSIVSTFLGIGRILDSVEANKESWCHPWKF